MAIPTVGSIRWLLFPAAVGAGPIYRLLGKRDLGTVEFPPPETAPADGEPAFRRHGGGHTTGPDRPAFLKFAGRYPGNAGAGGEGGQ
jgi:hypothetical protein